MSMAQQKYNLIWHSPPPRKAPGRVAPLAAVFLETPEVVEGVPDLGWVEVQGVVTPKEELLALLTLGAEVEHELMVQYLYAAASLDIQGNTSTQQLHELIRGIALQEMAHFVSVQNLLLAVGGPDYLHIGRDSIRSHSQENPLPFALEPVSDLTLSEFVLVESPGVIPDQALKERIAEMKLRVKKDAGIEPHRVGAFYTQIYWLLQSSDAPQGDLQLGPDPKKGRKPGWHLKQEEFTDPKTIAAHQAGLGEWHGSSGPDMLILTVGNENTPKSALADIALKNVFSIMEQGEGVAQGENSHFDRFLSALDLFARGGLSLLPLPRTPYAGPNPPAEAPVTTALQAPYTKLWAGLFDLRYSMLLLDIGIALSTPATNSGDRATAILWAFANMKPLLLQLIAQLSSKTLTAIEPCGPTFGLLYDELPNGPVEPWKRYQTLLQREKELISGLEARPELASDSKGKFLLGQIKNNSIMRSSFVAQRLGAKHIV
jgi:hypothetical protein